MKSESERAFHTEEGHENYWGESLFRSLHGVLGYTLNLFSVYIQLQQFPDQRNAGMVSFLFGYSCLRSSFPPFPLTAGDDPFPTLEISLGSCCCSLHPSHCVLTLAMLTSHSVWVEWSWRGALACPSSPSLHRLTTHHSLFLTQPPFLPPSSWAPFSFLSHLQDFPWSLPL